MPKTNFILRCLLGLSACASAFALNACQAQTEHDKIFFSCSREAPGCPSNQVCNFQDNCCHLASEPKGSSLGHCKLGPGGNTGIETLFPGGGQPDNTL